MTDLAFAPLNSAVVISLAVWERIPERFHAGFLDAVPSAVGGLRDEIRTAEREAIAEMVARGLTIVELDGAAIAEWEALAESAYPAISCRRDHPELFDRVLRLAAENSGERAN